LKKAMQDAEKRVEKLTSELKRYDAVLGDPALYGDPQRAQKMTIERGQVAKSLSEAEESWLEATSAFEEADSSMDDAVA
jgi:ATP-binding cassette subfamily F protein 3